MRIHVEFMYLLKKIKQIRIGKSGDERSVKKNKVLWKR